MQARKDDQDALVLAKARFATGKLLGAICFAPMILAAAGVLQGTRASVWDDGQDTQRRFLKNHDQVTRHNSMGYVGVPDVLVAFCFTGC